ncbi:Putative PAS/PAC sensor protein [Elusimicrobium minutum Pei191]|uniref:Putative PAS/PAC sensor protein n=1 Tax=Elusimicrobium minutum (strain Pei191) TaxID=445932 RepID=B2KCX1_ELUMP|nr:PAS domain-containing protein [Elusimicrobium minutum]ACC98367.1 Putative PAS/PAC sensor protein [Elusimicrobium minutum Pei191]
MAKGLFSFFSHEMLPETKAVFDNAKSLFENFYAPTLIIDDRGSILYANQKALDLLSYTAEEIDNTQITKLSIKKETITQQPVFYQKITAKDGKKIYSKIAVTIFEKEKLCILNIEELSPGSQITKDNIFQMTDSSPYAMIIRDKDGIVLFWNKKAEELTDVPAKDIIGQNLGVFVKDKKALKEIEKRDKEVISSKKQQYIQNLHIEFGDKKRIYNIFKNYMESSYGDVFLFDIFEDITVSVAENVKNQQVLAFLQALIDNVPLSLYARDKHGRYLLRNKKSVEMFHGGDTADFSENIAMLYDEEVAEDAWKNANNPKHESEERVKGYLSRENTVLKTGKILDIPVEEYKQPDGSTALIHLTKVPVRDKDGKMISVLSVAQDITADVKKERDILETKKLLEAVFMHSPIPMYVRDIDGKIILSNKTSEELLGRDTVRAEYVKDDAMDHYYISREQEMLKAGKIVDMPEETFITKTGDEFILHLIKAPIFDETGKPFWMLTIAEDITAKRKSEKEIITLNEFLQTVVDNLPVSLIAKKYNGEYILWNKKSEELFGYKASEVVGKDFYQTGVSQDLKDYIKEQDARVFGSGREMDIPQELISTVKEGVKIMHTVKTPIFKKDGTPDYLISVSEDITVKSKMEKQLRESREKYSLLVENSGEGVIIVERDKIIFANTTFAKLMGYDSVEELADVNINNLVSPQHIKEFEEVYNSVSSNVDVISPHDITLLKKDEDEVQLEVKAVTSKYMGKKIILMFFKDVTIVNRAIHDLRRDRELFRNSFENYPSELAIVSHNGYVSQLNSAARRMFGVRLEDRNVYRQFYIKPFLNLAARKKMKRLETAETEFIFDPSKFDGNLIKLSNGNKKNLSLKLVPINKKEIKKNTLSSEYLVVINEIIPIKADLDIQDVMLLNIPAVKCKTDGKIEAVNSAFFTLGLAKELCQKGALINNMFIKSDRRVVYRDMEELFKQGYIYSRFYHLQTPVPMEVEFNAAVTEDRGFIVTLKNNTAHKQMLELLAERQETTDAVLSVTNGAVIISKMRGSFPGKIVRANKEAQELFGYNLAEFFEMYLDNLMVSRNNSKTDFAKHIIEQHIEKIGKEGKAIFTANVYNKENKEFLAEIMLSLFNINSELMLLAVIRDVNSIVKLAGGAKLQNNNEMESIKKLLPGVMLKVDAEGIVEEGYAGGNSRGGIYNIARYQYKSPYSYLPKDVADHIIYSIKEAVSVNTPLTFSFSIKESDGIKSYEAAVSPIASEQKAFLLVREITNKTEFERRIQELYSVTSTHPERFTNKVDEILNLGKEIFKADAGFIMRYSGKNDGSFTIVYASENDININNGMVFPEEKCFSNIKMGDTIVSDEVNLTDCSSNSFCKNKEIKVLIAGPLYLSGEVTGALCFVSQKKKIKIKEGDSDFIGLMSRLLSFGIELREADKIVLESKSRLEKTLKYLSLPAAVIDKNGKVEFVNGKFQMVYNPKTEENLIGKDFFEEFTVSPPSARKKFYSINEVDEAFSWEQSFVTGTGKRIECVWKVNGIKDKNGKLSAYSLIADFK